MSIKIIDNRINNPSVLGRDDLEQGKTYECLLHNDIVISTDTGGITYFDNEGTHFKYDDIEQDQKFIAVKLKVEVEHA